MSTPSGLVENRARMARGELYHAFVPDLVAARNRCGRACQVYNKRAGSASPRERAELLRDVFPNLPQLPPKHDDPDEDAKQLATYPQVDPPLKADYGSQVYIGPSTRIETGLIALDTCDVRIGARVRMGVGVQLYAGGHPLDPSVRLGTAGPELGGPITIEDDAVVGGGAIVLMNLKIGRGAVVEAGSVVTKDVPPFTLVAGNPARVVRKIESEWADEYSKAHPGEEWYPAEKK
ncbi:hypothetical protein JCM8097_007557 [Rhodosporidiobolus ruineniae]